MNTNDKTLADVQPGGRVRLGDQAERGRFEAWAHAQSYRGGNIMADRDAVHPDVYADPIAQLTWKSWQAALSAPPSPGGQGDALVTDAMVEAAHAAYWAHPDDSGEDRPCMRAALEAALAARQPVSDQHPDDLAVDAFAAAMKAKMAAARAKGRGGWEDPAQCSADDLSSMLRDHVEKGDPRDVANFCMMLHQRGEAIAARQPVGEPVFRERSTHKVYRGSCGNLPCHCWADTDHIVGDEVKRYATQPAQAVDLGTGVKAIAAERERQLQAEGFTRDGDQQYRHGELARAATAYVQLAAMDLAAGGTRDHIAWHGPAAVWPWAPEWWKPVDARRDLVRAGALIAAQIDLIDSQAVGNG